MDGMELLREIKQNYPLIDVICMTGHGGSYTFTDVIKAGGSDFILKPFGEDEVEAKINRVIRERQLRAAFSPPVKVSGNSKTIWKIL